MTDLIKDIKKSIKQKIKKSFEIIENPSELGLIIKIDGKDIKVVKTPGSSMFEESYQLMFNNYSMVVLNHDYGNALLKLLNLI